jgi:hypothetical protein
MVAPRTVIIAIARAVERQHGDVDDLRNLVECWEDKHGDQSRANDARGPAREAEPIVQGRSPSGRRDGRSKQRAKASHAGTPWGDADPQIRASRGTLRRRACVRERGER